MKYYRIKILSRSNGGGGGGKGAPPPPPPPAPPPPPPPEDPGPDPELQALIEGQRASRFAGGKEEGSIFDENNDNTIGQGTTTDAPGTAFEKKKTILGTRF